MTQRGGTTEQVRGRVEQTNDKGVKVDGRWFNWSQFSRSRPLLDEGDDVELEIARGKFIDGARVVAKGDQGALGFADDPIDTPAASSAPSRAAPRSSTPNADRNKEIRRLSLIKSAADFAAARGMEPEEVITVASRWEEWVVEQS